MTEEEAITLYESSWWQVIPVREAVARQLHEERLIMPFDKFHELLTQVLGRPVWTHEFANGERLIAEFDGNIPPPAGPFESLAEILK